MELILIYKDDDYTEEVEVTTSRFSVGRHEDNDFIIDDSNLSRRHALIENFDGVYFLSDCGSQNGTKLNGKQVTGQVEIHDGDTILLGDLHEFRVKLGKSAENQPVASKPKTVSIKSGGGSSHRNNAATVAHQTSGLSVQAIQIIIGVIAVSVVLIIGAVAIILLTKGGGGGGKDTNNRPPINENENGNNGNPGESPQPNNSPSVNQPNDNSTPLPTPDPKLNNLEAAAKQFLLKFNKSDPRPYAFDEKTLAAINAKAEQFRNSTQLATALKTLQSSSGATVTARASDIGMQPGLLIFTALALTDGGKNGNPVDTANRIFDTLDNVRKIIGEGDVDSSLLVAVAHLEGPGTRSRGVSHPMLSRLREIIQDNRAQRNVWYLHDHNTKGGKPGVDDRGYNLAVTIVALGAISQNPQLFGVNASPLNF
jgi:hypothetical protein